MDWWFSMIGPATPVLVGLAAVILIIVRPFRSRRLRQREATALAASRLGMQYRPPIGSGGKEFLDEGRHYFSGQSAGVDWSVETVLLAEQAVAEPAPAGLAERSYCRWTSRVDAGVGNGYLLVMNLPAGAGRPEVRPGVLDALLDKVAALALFLYVRSYFGETRAGGLSLDPAHRRTLGDDTLDRDYLVFCHPEQRLSRLNEPTRCWLRQQCNRKLAVLWDGAGLAVSCPTRGVDPQAVADLAQSCLRLAELSGQSTLPDRGA